MISQLLIGERLTGIAQINGKPVFINEVSENTYLDPADAEMISHDLKEADKYYIFKNQQIQ